MNYFSSYCGQCSLSEDIDDAPTNDFKPRFRFYGYLAAYLQSIYGHRAGVLTNMTVEEVRKADGNEQTGYVIDVSVTI